MRLLHDTEGAEYAEWILVVAIIVLLGIALYMAVIPTQLKEMLVGVFSRVLSMFS
jgi:Flp pilus assembly pilin Flp